MALLGRAHRTPPTETRTEHFKRRSRVGRSSALLARTALHSSKGTFAATEMVLEVTRGSLSALCPG